MDELRRIDLNLLLTLHALLTEEHVSRAAVRLHKSQPAVSHSLALLRAHFDDPLLVRHGGRMGLTPKAQGLAQPLADALGRLNGLLAPSHFDPSTASLRVRIALSDYAASILLPPLVRHLRAYAPGVDLAVVQSSRQGMLTQLVDGELDLALGIFPEATSGIVVQDLFVESFVCVADKATLPARGGLSLDQWLARPHALVSLRPDVPEEVEQALSALGHTRRVALTLAHWSLASEAIEGTDLVLTVASRAIGSLLGKSALRSFAPPFALPTFAYQQAWHERRQADPAHVWLRGVVTELLGSG